VVSYTAIGASDASGYGGSVFCAPFTDCPNGTGYVQLIARRLQAAGKTVSLLNLGIPTAVLSPATEALGASLGKDIYGNFLTQEMPFVAKDATLVTVFAGGNDVNTVGAALDAGRGGADNTGYVAAQSQNFGSDLRTLVAGIKARAPQARIVILNLPNMGALPYASGYSLDRRRWLQQIAVGFSAQINALTAQGALVIDLMCDASFYQPSIFSSDGFHPSDAGYQHLADIMYAAITGGSAATPRSSCAQMSVF
jgi:lysophospholipase L1-like esterase